VVGALLLFQLAAGYVLYLLRPQAMVIDSDSVMPVASYIRAHTRPGERVLVVSNQSEVIHFHADRLPISRFLYLEDAIVAYTRGRAVEEIHEALTRVPPRLAVVAAARPRQGGPHFVERITASYLATHYELVHTLTLPRITWLIYERRR
jgi:hypothetical protein